MHYTIERLVNGDQMVSAHFQAAVARWREIFAKPEAQDTGSLAQCLQGQQMWFERNCGGRWPGQEVMVLAGFGCLYTTQSGFGENEARACRLAEAFEKSMCSFEVKSLARAVARQYDVPGFSEND